MATLYLVYSSSSPSIDRSIIYHRLIWLKESHSDFPDSCEFGMKETRIFSLFFFSFYIDRSIIYHRLIRLKESHSDFPDSCEFGMTRNPKKPHQHSRYLRSTLRSAVTFRARDHKRFDFLSFVGLQPHCCRFDLSPI